MNPRIQHGRHILRVARGTAPGWSISARRPPTNPSLVAAQFHRFQIQSFATSPSRRQERRQAPPPPEPPAPVPETTEPVQATPAPPSGSTQAAESSKPPKKRLAPRIIFAAVFILIGSAAGSSLRLLLSPPNPPEPGTAEDEYTKQVLREQAAKLPLVQQLSADPAWQSWDAYESFSPEQRAQHITAGALAGSRGVGGYQRIFYHPASGEFVSVVYFGGATTGWPGVVHGGCLATILDESCGRAAFKQWGGKPGVTASLTLEYKRVTLANGFYVVRVRPRAEEDLLESERGKRHYKCFVDATVEDAATGTVTATAEALFVGGQGKKKKSLVSWGGEAQESHIKF